jgi:hypothetical protein
MAVQTGEVEWPGCASGSACDRTARAGLKRLRPRFPLRRELFSPIAGVGFGSDESLMF